MFLIASFIVGRDRPPVEQLDPPAPSGSFPSGHTAAAVAFYGAVLRRGVLAHPQPCRARALFVVVAVAVPLIVAALAASSRHAPPDRRRRRAAPRPRRAVSSCGRASSTQGVDEIDRAADPRRARRGSRLDLTEPTSDRLSQEDAS